jgi:GntR family transcriptional regulator
MDPQPTQVPPPIHLRIADDLRMKIERGDLAAGDSLPTLHELCQRWDTSLSSARAAIALLKQQGLITGGRGKAPVVRRTRRRIVRSSDRHQVEKDLVHAPEQERRSVGAAELDLGIPVEQLTVVDRYETVAPDDDLCAVLGIDPDTALLRREHETSDPQTGQRLSFSVSYIPRRLLEPNPVLLSVDCEPWPGGTQHQLFTVGIELARVVDEVTAVMPTTVDMQRWGLDNGVPMLRVRRISIDTQDRVVEVSDAEYPADRTELRFTTPLALW